MLHFIPKSPWSGLFLIPLPFLHLQSGKQVAVASLFPFILWDEAQGRAVDAVAQAPGLLEHVVQAQAVRLGAYLGALHAQAVIRVLIDSCREMGREKLGQPQGL